MSYPKAKHFPLLIGLSALITLQVLWIRNSYLLERRQLQSLIADAFEQAHQKEQTYRIPVVDIVNPGAVTIQSCGTEEILIIRNCPETDTISYNNVSGYPVENFISRVFRDLREQIVPMNIHCLSDLFGGMLHEKNIPLPFVIERLDRQTGKIIETTLFPENKAMETPYSENYSLEISEKELIRVNYSLTPGIIAKRIEGTLTGSFILLAAITLCLYLPYRKTKKKKDEPQPEPDTNPEEHCFFIGNFTFDPAKNELCGEEKNTQLNKKENAILYALCRQQGNVVERHLLLEENWGDKGLLYSRSLDTYITTLRKYFKDDPSIQIITIKGVGYKLTCEQNRE